MPSSTGAADSARAEAPLLPPGDSEWITLDANPYEPVPPTTYDVHTLLTGSEAEARPNASLVVRPLLDNARVAPTQVVTIIRCCDHMGYMVADGCHQDGMWSAE